MSVTIVTRNSSQYKQGKGEPMIAKDEKRHIFSGMFMGRLLVITTLIIYALPLVGAWGGMVSVSSGTSEAANGHRSSLVGIRVASRSQAQRDATSAQAL